VLVEWPFTASEKWPVNALSPLGGAYMLVCYLYRGQHNQVHFFIEDEDYFVLGDFLDDDNVRIALRSDVRNIT
jgi:hypothetical protein